MSDIPHYTESKWASLIPPDALPVKRYKKVSMDHLDPTPLNIPTLEERDAYNYQDKHTSNLMIYPVGGKYGHNALKMAQVGSIDPFGMCDKIPEDMCAKLNTMLTNLPKAMLDMLTSPQFYEFMAFEMGIQITQRLLRTAIAKSLQAVAEDAFVTKMIEEGAAKLGAGFANSEILMAVIERMLTEEMLGEFAAAMVEMMVNSIDLVFAIITIIQFIGMFLDMVDPNGYNSMLDPDMLEKLRKTFDLQVGTMLLGYSVNWPLIYTADSLLAQISDPARIRKLSLTHSSEYLMALTVNSNGVKIIHNLPTHVYKMDDLGELLLQVTNCNATVAQWIRTHGKTVAAIAVGLIVLVMIFSSSKKKRSV